MPTRLSRYLRERIIRLWEEGNSISSIVTILHSEGRVTTRATVHKWIFRWQHCGLDDQYRSGRPSKVTAEMAEFMEAELEKDNETTSAEPGAIIGKEIQCSAFHTNHKEIPAFGAEMDSCEDKIWPNDIRQEQVKTYRIYQDVP